MASGYIGELLKKVKLPGHMMEAVRDLTRFKADDAFEECKKSNFRIRGKLAPLINELVSELAGSDVEESLRKVHIEEIKRKKTLLETKLEKINNSIKQAAVEESKPPRYNLQIEKHRREYFEEQKRKSDEAAKKAHEYHLAQQQRQKKIERHLTLLKEELDNEKEEEVIKAKGNMKKFEDNYKFDLEKMKENTRRRKQELEEAKYRQQQFVEAVKEKPLYQKMEEKFVEVFEIKELEKRKMELAKKRQMFQPLSKQELLEHIKKHDTIIREKEKSISLVINSEKNTYNSKFLQEIKEREKQQKISEENALKEKLDRIMNKKSYGESVREMYTPTIDRFKQMELLLRLEKLKNPVIKKKFNYENSTAAQSDGEIKRTVKKKVKIDEKNEKVREKPADYLAEMRQKRKDPVWDIQDEDWEENFGRDFDEDKIKKVKRRAQSLEKKAKIAELALTSATPVEKVIEHTVKADSMLISSIRAKLAVLNHV